MLFVMSVLPVDDKAAARLGLSMLRAFDSHDEESLNFIRMMHDPGEVFAGALSIAQAFAQALGVELGMDQDKVFEMMQIAMDDKD